MNAVLDDVLKAALALPAEARETLIEELSRSLEADGVDLDEATEAILLRRLASAESGNVIEADEMLRRIRQKLG